ncbi:hypothetical protein J437_LFUL007324 [Ladona fulva]|uniref:Dolichol-phosphate mannosyltransferase subunit 3 n=1 Tax=Ladona fulva TaxID=123851 RepID=A0A8K0K5V9_LADFU|nr:hypothetical protein J437_LFUL007324 [Ladona fulva]
MSGDDAKPGKPIIMTKLMQWLLGASVLFAIWGSFVTKQVEIPILDKWSNLVLFFPVIAIILFGLYAAMVVLWRVYNFNDCEEAAKELLEQIKEARKDLINKGMIFKEVTEEASGK